MPHSEYVSMQSPIQFDILSLISIDSRHVCWGTDLCECPAAEGVAAVGQR